MLRMIPKAAALFSLVAASMAGTSSRAQVIDLRMPPYGHGPSARSSQHHAPAHLGQGVNPYLRADHQDLRLPSPYPQGSGAYPGTIPGAVAYPFPGQHGPGGHHGAHPAPQHPGGFPGGAYPMPTPTAPIPGAACPTGPSPALATVDAMIGQLAAFLQVFGPTRDCVPEGKRIERDAIALYESALAFRQAAAAGAPPQTLHGLFAAMDDASCRLVSRVNRIAAGRTGPNIQQVQHIAALCNQVRALI